MGIPLILLEIGQTVPIQVIRSIVNQWIQSIVDLESVRHIVGIGVGLIGIGTLFVFFQVGQAVFVRIVGRVVHIVFSLPNVGKSIPVGVDPD